MSCTTVARRRRILTATTEGRGRDRKTAFLPAPPGESGIGGQAGMTCTAVARRKQTATAITVCSRPDRHARFLPRPSGPMCVGRQAGITRTAVARRAVLLPAPAVARRERTVSAITVGPGWDRHARFLPRPSGPACVGRQAGITRTAVARRAARPAGSGR
ncbi:hypothetical protein ABZ379_36380 [Streptomyces canus]|uniref:hypothetical protein n=1 Tax=Streptomyces canus TaxID=58343 RepID=UPI0033CDBF24